MCLYFVMHSCVFILSCTHLCFLKPFLLSKPPFSGWYHRHWHRSDSSIQGAGQSTPAAFVRELSLERHWGQHCGPVSRPWQVCHLHLLCSQYSIFWACVGKYDRLSVFLLPHWPISWGSGRPALVVPAPVCELQQGWGVAEWVEHRVQQAADTSSSLWCGKGLNPRVSPWQTQEETDWMEQAGVQKTTTDLCWCFLVEGRFAARCASTECGSDESQAQAGVCGRLFQPESLPAGQYPAEQPAIQATGILAVVGIFIKIL